MCRGVWNGLKTGYRPLLWSAAALVLLFSIAVPGVNVLTITFLMVPYVVLYTMLPAAAFAVHMLVIWVAGYLLIGPAALIVGLFFLIPGIVMGQLYKKKASARTAITGGTLALLAQFLLELLILQFAFDIALLSEMGNIIRENIATLSRDGLMPGNWTADMTEELIRTSMQSLPVMLIIVSFVYAAVTHFLARRALRTAGIEVAAFPQAKDWMLPRSFVFYYLIVILFDLFMTTKDNTYFSVVIINLLPLLRFAFTVQAIGFFFFLAAQKNWPRVVPLLLTVPVLLFPPLSLIGVIDVAFPLRKSFTKP
ncbi:DUF2232 domain-containing protein [Paenibacillus sambharensis]|uniref:DUF2232 domain-containing protein n=1 Tax=Paenibacillus sambharensis TaxID=1803190 RepID=A0A2W1LNU4_9BACL|nr:DUF2232 domain-containing protein [Paenibacillus sambharensis]